MFAFAPSWSRSLHSCCRQTVAPLALASLFLLTVGLSAAAQDTPSDADKAQLQISLDKLQAAVEELDPRIRVDAEICSKGVEWILRHNEFFRPNYLQSARKCIEIGLQRVEQLRQGQSNWGQQPGIHAVGYRSKIDDSVQPYLVTLPEGFSATQQTRWPLYVVLHGRNANLTEAHFIAGSDGKPAPRNQDWIQIEVFGRTNNAYRWAGETDVFEAIEDVSKRYRIDESRVTLWGFSMGGAGAWHLGVHHPSRWASVGGGAGFVDFYEYQKQTEQLPDYQHRALNIYDAKVYAPNLSAVPFITYGGEEDPQLQASLIMQREAERAGLQVDVIIGPKMGHKFDDVSKATFMEFLQKYNAAGRDRVVGLREFQFVTYTLKYNTCEWVTIEEQELPLDKSVVTSREADDGTLHLTTENVAALSVLRTAGNQIVIDDSESFDLISAADGNLLEVYFVKDPLGWTLLDYDDSLAFQNNPERRKRHNLQGPIDDAFMQPFVCVRGTGTPWSAPLQKYADFSLQRFEQDFDKWLRAKPPVVSDAELTAEQFKNRHLILFGDPGSNAVLRRIVEQLPLTWTEREITFNGQTYSTDQHAVVFIYPNPLNPEKYVVINSGMTVRERDFKASNAWLFPKWGDHASLRFTPTNTNGFAETILNAGFFNANWEPE